MSIEIPNYQLLQRLGEGAMSEVWLAEHRINRRKAAIKILGRSLSDPDAEALFVREGEVLAGFRDEGIVAIYDNSRVGDIAYLVMEHLPGGSLLDRMRRGPISVGETVAIVAQLARALGVAHRAGIIHRDLKPANVLFRDDATPVLTDFGASRMLERSTIYGKDGGVIGTPAYMSPEQIQGQTLDGRSDLYALGVILFELLAGELPFPGGSVTEIASQHVFAPIPRLPAPVAMLQPVLERLLAKQPEDRYGDAEALIAALRGVYLDEEELRRQVGYAATGAAWSSQLRALGFQLDARGRTEVRVAQGDHLRKTALLPPAGSAAAPDQRPFRWLASGAILTAVLVMVLLAWRLWPALDSRPAPAPLVDVAPVDRCIGACADMRRIVDAADAGFTTLRGGDASLVAPSTFAPEGFSCRVSARQTPTSLDCSNDRMLTETSREQLFRNTRATLLEALPGAATLSNTGSEFVLGDRGRRVLLRNVGGPTANPHRLSLSVEPASLPAVAATCDELCEGICAVMNSAAAGYKLPYTAPGGSAEAGFTVPSAAWCGGKRAADGSQGAERTWYRCDFGDIRSKQDADREFDRVAASLRAALAGWKLEAWTLPQNGNAGLRRNLRAGNGEVLVELAARRDGGGHKVSLDFTTLYDPTFSPLCR